MADHGCSLREDGGFPQYITGSIHEKQGQGLVLML